MNITRESIEQLGSVIENSLAELDLRGTNPQINHAMVVVREAFAAFLKNAPINPNDLIQKAREIARPRRDSERAEF